MTWWWWLGNVHIKTGCGCGCREWRQEGSNSSDGVNSSVIGGCECVGAKIRV